MGNKIVEFFKKPSTIKALCFILYYILIMYILSDFVFGPLLGKIIKSITDGPIKDLSLKTRCIISASYNAFIYILLFIPILIGYHFEVAYDYYAARSNKNFSIIFLCSFIGFYIVNIVSNILSNAIYDGDSTSTNQLTFEIITKNNAISGSIMFISVVFIGPFVEEMIFRQAIFDVCKNKYVSIAVSSVLFAMIHILTSSGSLRYMIATTIPYLFSGLAFSIIYEKSHRNIYASLLVHMASNLLAVFAVIL